MHRRERALQIANEIRLFPREHRGEALDRACGGDTELRKEVGAILRALDQVDAGRSMATPDAPTSAQEPVIGPAGDALPTPTDPTLPSRIGKYRVLRRLGQGGFGVVYQAVSDDGLRKVVALKVLRPGLASPNAVRRFQRERQILPSLHHPNIAGFLDADETSDGQPFFVMEYVEGTPITAYCDDNNLRVRERLALFERICEAVQHAHARFVLHRDLKPSNILVDKDGTPKLLDFGIARLLSRDAEASADLVTIGDEVALTPEYASPEQLRGDPLTTASDVYSLGVLLYELLTGHRPYELRSRLREAAAKLVDETRVLPPSEKVKTTEEITTSVASDPPTTRTVEPGQVATKRSTSVERLRRSLAGDIDNIALKALRKEPVRRYASAQELLDDLRRHQDGQPVHARGDSWGYRASTFVRRQRMALGAASIVVASLGMTTYAYIGRLQDANQRAWERARLEEERADDQAQRAREQAERDSERLALAEARAKLTEGLIGDLLATPQVRALLEGDGNEFSGSLQARLAGFGLMKRVLEWSQRHAGESRLLRIQHASISTAMLRTLNAMISGTLGGDQELRERAIQEVAAPTVREWESLLVDEPRSPVLLTGLALALTRHARLELRAGHAEASLALAARAVEIARAVPPDQPDGHSDAAPRVALAEALLTRGMTQLRRDRSRSTSSFEEALEIADRLAADSDDAAPAWSLVVDACSFLGQVEEERMGPDRADHLAKAATLYGRALEIAERWSAANQNDPRAQRALLNSLQWCARVERQLHRYDSAIALLSRFDVAAAALKPVDPDFAQRLSDISRGAELQGRLYAEQGRDEEAAAAFAKALDALEDADRMQGGKDVAIVRRMMNLYASLGESSLASDQLDQARVAFEHVSSRADEVAGGGTFSSMLGCLAKAEAGLGLIALRNGDQATAEQRLAAAKGARERIAALKDPDPRFAVVAAIAIGELEARITLRSADPAAGRAALDRLLALDAEEAVEACAAALVEAEAMAEGSRLRDWCDLAQLVGAQLLKAAPADAEFRSPRLVRITEQLDGIRRRRCG